MTCNNCKNEMIFTGDYARNINPSKEGIKIGFPIFRCVACRDEQADISRPRLLHDRPVTITIFEAEEVTI